MALLLLFAGIIPIKSYAYDIEVGTKVPGIDIYYMWTNNKTELGVKIVEYDLSKAGTRIINIPDSVYYNGQTYPVTSIESNAFYAHVAMEGVIIPNTVKYIGYNAFGSCSSLTDIVIPNSVKSIENETFQSCQNLTNVIMSDSITFIGDHAFSGCSKLTSITIPNSVTKIDEHAFGECKGLTNVLIPNNVKEIGRKAFYECINLKKVVIEGNPIIKQDAFYFHSLFGKLDTIVLKSQTPPQMIYNPCYDVFGYPFTEHTFNNAILSVPEGYYYAYMASDTWSRFKHICTYSDNEYNSDFESDSIYYTLQEDGVYVTAHGAKIHNDNGGDGPLTPRDPSSGGLQPRTQTRVSPQDNTPDSSDYKPYRGNIMIPESVSVYDTVYTVTGINALAFQRCNELESVTIPNSVKRIGYASFAECTSLSEITIPAGVEFIDQYAFAYCSNLKHIVIQGNPEIDETAFIGCGTDLEVIYTVVENHKALDPDSVQEGAIHYGIDGRVIQSDTPGLHLIKHKDGTVTKTLVR